MTWKRAALGILVIVVVATAGLAWWVRSIVAGDAVRLALERQLSDALGQPVRIRALTASIYPRATVNLEDVSIGSPARVTAARLHVGTSIRALLSRRIEEWAAGWCGRWLGSAGRGCVRGGGAAPPGGNREWRPNAHR